MQCRWLINAAYIQLSYSQCLVKQLEFVKKYDASTGLARPFSSVITTSIVHVFNEIKLALIVGCIDYPLRCMYGSRAEEKKLKLLRLLSEWKLFSYFPIFI
jgi:hypothetical protein